MSLTATTRRACSMLAAAIALLMLSATAVVASPDLGSGEVASATASAAPAADASDDTVEDGESIAADDPAEAEASSVLLPIAGVLLVALGFMVVVGSRRRDRNRVEV